jgi:23S rRNA (cytosine1962-C5)-methyltransferase
MPREGFEHAVHAASLLAGVRLKLAEARGQAPDHPILMGVPETAYLKFYIFQVV